VQYLDEANKEIFEYMVNEDLGGYEHTYLYTKTEQRDWVPYLSHLDKMTENELRIKKYIGMFEDHKLVNYMRNKGLVEID
jgi:hypothetical protein